MLLQSESQQCPGCVKAGVAAGKEGDCFPVLCLLEASVSRSAAFKTRRTVEVDLESQRDDQRVEASPF